LEESILKSPIVSIIIQFMKHLGTIDLELSHFQEFYHVLFGFIFC